MGLERGRGEPVLLPRIRSRQPRGKPSCWRYESGSSLGAVIEVVADGVPPGLGAPIYGKLDATSRRP